MSRGRKRKSQKGLFSEECMRTAVRQVLIGEGGVKLSLRKAAEENGLSFQTLQRYVKKEREKTDPNMQISMKSQYKHRLIFTDNEERALVDYVIMCSKMCYGQTTKDTRELAYEMAKINQKKIPLSWEINKLAGIDWLQGFLKRHSKQLSIRQPEGCSLSRASSFNEHNVKLFFDNLKKAYDRSEAFSDGTRIYNLDETGTTTVQKPKKVLSAKGVKQVSQCTSGERGVLITTCCIISASGNTLPPAMVFPRKKFKSHMLNGAPSGTLGLATSTGWMNGEIFPSVMKHFVKYSGSSKENPTILIFDNHESHLTIVTLNIAKDNGVTIITLPPHCSHKLQPLDISIFAPLKAYYNSAVDSWLLHHPGKPLTIYEVAGCVGVAVERSMTPLNIKAGFKKTGIFPFDREIFTPDDFLSSSVTDRDVLNDSALYTADEQTASTTMDIPPVIEDFTEEIPSNSVETSHFIQVPADKHPGVAIPSTSLNTPQVTDNPAEDKPATTVFVSPQIFKGYPKAGQRKLQKSKRKRATSCIPTDTPEKEKIEQREMEKKKKNRRKERKLAKETYLRRNENRSLRTYLPMKMIPKLKVRYLSKTILMRTGGFLKSNRQALKNLITILSPMILFWYNSRQRMMYSL